MDEAVARVAAGELAPECKKCGGYLKTATISFGQAMPERELNRAYEAAETCDAFIVAGSSLVVYPAAYLPALAKQNNACLIIVNRTETPLDEYADLVVREDIGKALPKLVGMEISH
jgi:NAD-dependent deacetylase